MLNCEAAQLHSQFPNVTHVSYAVSILGINSYVSHQNSEMGNVRSTSDVESLTCRLLRAWNRPRAERQAFPPGPKLFLPFVRNFDIDYSFHWIK